MKILFVVSISFLVHAVVNGAQAATQAADFDLAAVAPPGSNLTQGEFQCGARKIALFTADDTLNGWKIANYDKRSEKDLKAEIDNYEARFKDDSIVSSHHSFKEAVQKRDLQAAILAKDSEVRDFARNAHISYLLQGLELKKARAQIKALREQLESGACPAAQSNGSTNKQMLENISGSGDAPAAPVAPQAR